MTEQKKKQEKNKNHETRIEESVLPVWYIFETTPCGV
jgi:hypothetical protein